MRWLDDLIKHHAGLRWTILTQDRVEWKKQGEAYAQRWRNKNYINNSQSK